MATMTANECRQLLGVIRTFIQMAPHQHRDMADLFDLLSQLEQGQKQAFWAWMGDNAPNLKRWLIAKGDTHRRAA